MGVAAKLRNRDKNTPPLKPLRLDTGVGSTAAATAAQEAKAAKQADAEKKKKIILQNLNDDIVRYIDSGSKGKNYEDITEKLNHYRELEHEIQHITLKGDDLKYLYSIESQTAKIFENKFKELLDEANKIIGELAELEKGKKQEKQISNLDYFIIAIINYIKLLWKTRLFFKYEREKEKVINIEKNSDLIFEYYTIISDFPKILIFMFDKIGKLKARGENFKKLMKDILEKLALIFERENKDVLQWRKIPRYRRIGKQYDALAEIGKQIQGPLNQGGNKTLRMNMETFITNYCNKKIMAEKDDGEISDCGDMKLKIENVLHLNEEQTKNFNLDVEQKLTELRESYPMIPLKPDTTDDIPDSFPDNYVEKINAIFANFKEQSTSTATTTEHSYADAVTGAQKRERRSSSSRSSSSSSRR